MRTALFCLFAVLLTATTCNSSRNACICLKISNSKPRISTIKSYHVQNSGLCHIEAVVFRTWRGRTVCADPMKPWVTDAMKVVDARKKSRSTTAGPMTTVSERTLITTVGFYSVN